MHNDLKAFINTLADTARNIAMDYFRKPLAIRLKDNQSPVTQADQAIETALRTQIQAQFPRHGIFGEEFDETEASSKYTWVIDPIDGTVAFTMGKPSFSTLIGLMENDHCVMGLIEQPYLKERWFGATGHASTLNDQAIHTSACATLASARLSCTTPEIFKSRSQQRAFEALRAQVQGLSYGGDGYAYGLLACGHIDIVMESSLQFYDIAALVPIIEGAGGKITDWQGKPLTRAFDGTCLATANATLHDAALAIII